MIVWENVILEFNLNGNTQNCLVTSWMTNILILTDLLSGYELHFVENHFKIIAIYIWNLSWKCSPLYIKDVYIL